MAVWRQHPGVSALKRQTLPQVLSVDTALSIQSHPDKELAAQLHAERPEVSSCAAQPVNCFAPGSGS